MAASRRPRQFLVSGKDVDGILVFHSPFPFGRVVAVQRRVVVAVEGLVRSPFNMDILFMRTVAVKLESFLWCFTLWFMCQWFMCFRFALFGILRDSRQCAVPRIMRFAVH